MATGTDITKNSAENMANKIANNLPPKAEIKKMEENAVSLLKKMISIKSLSFEEQEVSNLVFKELCATEGIEAFRIGKNIIAYNKNFNPDNKARKTLMLNSHLDTVEAAKSYTSDPYRAEEKRGKITGLGSNDAGASVVSMIEAFKYFTINDRCKSLNANLLLVLSTEEEKSGNGGMELIIKEFSKKKYARMRPDIAIIGEPTGMRAAVAERGLIVLDGEAIGKSGHAARNEGINALYIAIEDIEKLRNHKFRKRSPLMGDVKLTVTQINAGTAHNVIPDRCNFTVDIRPTERYTNEEIWKSLQKITKSRLVPRSLIHKVSATPPESALIQCIKKTGLRSFISPTVSDWTRISIPAIKMGPGESSRSHRADEYIMRSEIGGGIEKYIRFIKAL